MWLIDRSHVHVAFGRPRRSGNVPQPGRRQIETGLTVGEGADDTGSSPDLVHDALERIVRSNLPPIDGRKGIAGERLVNRLLDEISCFGHTACPQIRDDGPGFLVGRGAALLGMNGLEHVAHLADPGRRHVAEDIAIKCTMQR